MHDMSKHLHFKIVVVQELVVHGVSVGVDGTEKHSVEKQELLINCEVNKPFV